MSVSRSNSRFGFLAAACLVLLLAVFGLWSQRPSGQAGKASSSRRITIAQVGDFFLYAPLYVAADAGFFGKQRIDATIVNTDGDDKTWAAVLGGSAQFGVADPTFVAVSAARGQDGVVIASLVNGVPFWGITFQNLSPFKDAIALNHYSVATFPSPSTAYALQKRMFVEAGLPPNIRQGAFGAIIPMLKAKTADIGLELEPNVSQAVSDGATVLYSLAERYGDFAMTGVTTTEATVRNDPQLVLAVRAALQEAIELLHNAPDEALTFLLRRFPAISPQVAKAALLRVLKDGVIPRSVTIGEEAWNKAIQLRMEVGDLTATASYSRFVWAPPLKGK